MATGCCGKNGETLIFTCAGAAHGGQVANRAGINLMQKAEGSLFCIAAVGAEIPDKMQRARAAGKRVVIDGCDAHCALKIMENRRLPVDLHVDVTHLGIEKQPEQPHLIVDARRVAEYVAKTLG